jgi:hypothetical protein
MGRNPTYLTPGVSRRVAGTDAERQQRRRDILRHEREVATLVAHVRRVLEESSAAERERLLDRLTSLLEQFRQ